ncbi:hypothetical protein [Tropicimonas aquimaris]|uniref:Porin n=1 Tax=Tropicimonas aquimaris TaxID=914152 RepID=A0ABW3IPG0_9RHOB
MSFVSKRFAVALVTLLLPGTLVAQEGLSGPSSVAAELSPRDGLTDPQPRTNFPRNALPGYFGWKDRLAEGGFRFNLDYLTLGARSHENRAFRFAVLRRDC